MAKIWYRYRDSNGYRHQMLAIPKKIIDTDTKRRYLLAIDTDTFIDTLSRLIPILLSIPYSYRYRDRYHYRYSNVSRNDTKMKSKYHWVRTFHRNGTFFLQLHTFIAFLALNFVRFSFAGLRRSGYPSRYRSERYRYQKSIPKSTDIDTKSRYRNRSIPIAILVSINKI